MVQERMGYFRSLLSKSCKIYDQWESDTGATDLELAKLVGMLLAVAQDVAESLENRYVNALYDVDEMLNYDQPLSEETLEEIRKTVGKALGLER